MCEGFCGEKRWREEERGRERKRKRKGDPGVARKCSIVLQLSRSAEDCGGGKRAFLIFVFFIRKRV